MATWGDRSIWAGGAALAMSMAIAFSVGRSDAQQTATPAMPEPLAVYDLSQPPALVPEAVVPQSAAQVSLSFAPVVKAAAPAVVNIYTRAAMTPRYRDPLFDMLFGGRRGPQQREPQTSLGSGVIVDESGVILTNAHVIEGADEITVSLKDRREYIARVLLVDERTDLAVLKVDASGLPTLSFRDSDTMEVGDLVLAIGNPFGVGQTVTSGIVSAQARSTDEGRVFIQTDAAINPGNSGGALVDMSGRLIGINTMILSPSGGSNGIGFAIPADLAQQAVESASAGSVTIARPWIGVDGQPVTQEIAESLGLAIPNGVILSSLHPRSTLAEAGLSAGDVLLTVEGFPVSDLTALDYRFGTGRIGEMLPVTYMRGGTTLSADVQLITAPEDPPRDESQIAGRTPISGVVIANINPALAQENSLDPTLEGVIVVEVMRGIAARFGIRPGDILREINGTNITRVSDVDYVLGQTQNRWRIAIERDGRILRLETRG